MGAWHRLTGWVRAKPLLAGAIVAGLTARIVSWAVAGRVIDDALITIKHSKNAAEGIGLIHNLGDGHVHGFTSALSVLVPIPGELISDGGGLVLIRLVSLAAFVLAAIYAYRIAQELRIGPWPTGLALAYLALDQNQVFFGVAGMETQIAVAVLLAGAYYVLVEDFTRSGIALGLALLARPDFVIWVAPAYLFLLIRNRPKALRAAALTAAIVVPWIVFATLYYGSPVPNTIIAKAVSFAPKYPPLSDIGGWLTYVADTETYGRSWTIVAPFVERAFVLDTPLPRDLLKVIAYTVLVLAVIGAVATWKRPSWRPVIICAAGFVAYKLIFLRVSYFEWYGMPPLALIFLLAAAGLHRITLPRPRLAVPVAAALALAYAMHFPFTLPIDRTAQHEIEDQVRRPLGRYLGELIQPGESFTSESSGYVGYYSNGTLYDFPGLVSKTVVERLREEGGATFGTGYASPWGVVALMRPDFAVFRPDEWAGLQGVFPEVAKEYRPLRTFSVPEEETETEQWGLSVSNIDREFIVVRRVSDAGAGSDAGGPSAEQP